MDSSITSVHPRAGTEDWMAARLKVSTAIVSYYAISLAALIGIFILGHWARRLSWDASRSSVLYPVVTISRVFRKCFLRRLPGFTSVGHATMTVIYVAFNALFSFWRVDFSKNGNVASRFGCLFLALKNTPLAILTAYSYERLNSLHRIAGYTTLVYTILHASIYAEYFISEGRIYILQEDIVTSGIVAGFGMLFTVLAGTILQRRNYELFYIIHLALFVVILITFGLHRPHLESDKALGVAIFIATIWGSDRLLRMTRLAFNSINNEATIFPLPNGGTRIVIKKQIMRARPGKHCYVWLPHIRKFETHPFTIVANEPLELIINSHSGFTRDLHQYASSSPGATLKVSVEGPYGTLPDPMDYDKVVLVAGGTGATFTFGLAADMIRRLSPDSNKQIEFIWVSRKRDNIEWFTQHLDNLISHDCAPQIGLKIHLTRANTVESTSAVLPHIFSDSQPKHFTSLDKEIGLQSGSGTESSSTSIREADPEKRNDSGSRKGATSTFDNLPIIYGRPDIETSVREAIMSTGKDDRVLVAACGPTGLVDTVRNTTASCISVDGPSVELHCEQFGW
ncbi:ferric reductase NAD binding domain-containing protein [Xylaria arbuscula]|nr:ferric reductase NAD binding domain-containing protein [Xylaria arbuscula]